MSNKVKLTIKIFAFIFIIGAIFLLSQPFFEGWPLTVNQASSKLINALSGEEVEKLKNTTKEGLIKYHLGLGMGIRNDFGLWRGNIPLLLSAGESNPDRVSQIIILRTWEKLQIKGSIYDK